MVHGFWFDPNTTNCKIANVLVGHGDDNKPYAQVFSLRENSWRKIEISFSPSANNNSVYSPLLIGTCHWLVKTHDGEWIIRFDMRNEVFSTMNLPEDSQSCEGWLFTNTI